jgi:hypothetical protein
MRRRCSKIKVCVVIMGHQSNVVLTDSARFALLCYVGYKKYMRRICWLKLTETANICASEL